MELHYLIAPAYNAIRLPLMVFTDREAAVRYLTDLGMVTETFVNSDRISVWNVKDVVTGETVTLESYVRNHLRWDENVPFTPRQEHVERIVRALFKSGHYDGGNGELYRLDIETHPAGTPVTVWDFD